MMQEFVPVLQVGHGLFNAALLAAFLAQGWLGWRIRRGRAAGFATDILALKRHRRQGPILALLLGVGYLAGVSTAFVHKGRWVPHPLHFAAGTLLIALVAATVVVSKRIQGPATPARTTHFLLGIVVLGVFFTQALLGLAVLF